MRSGLGLLYFLGKSNGVILQIQNSKSCDIDLRNFNKCENCEYKHQTSLGLTGQ